MHSTVLRGAVTPPIRSRITLRRDPAPSGPEPRVRPDQTLDDTCQPFGPSRSLPREDSQSAVSQAWSRLSASSLQRAGLASAASEQSSKQAYLSNCRGSYAWTQAERIIIVENCRDARKQLCAYRRGNELQLAWWTDGKWEMSQGPAPSRSHSRGQQGRIHVDAHAIWMNPAPAQASHYHCTVQYSAGARRACFHISSLAALSRLPLFSFPPHGTTPRCFLHNFTHPPLHSFSGHSFLTVASAQHSITASP